MHMGEYSENHYKMRHFFKIIIMILKVKKRVMPLSEAKIRIHCTKSCGFQMISLIPYTRKRNKTNLR